MVRAVQLSSKLRQLVEEMRRLSRIAPAQRALLETCAHDLARRAAEIEAQVRAGDAAAARTVH
jgi:hypothetical protein